MVLILLSLVIIIKISKGVLIRSFCHFQYGLTLDNDCLTKVSPWYKLQYYYHYYCHYLLIYPCILDIWPVYNKTSQWTIQWSDVRCIPKNVSTLTVLAWYMCYSSWIITILFDIGIDLKKDENLSDQNMVFVYEVNICIELSPVDRCRPFG